MPVSNGNSKLRRGSIEPASPQVDLEVGDQTWMGFNLNLLSQTLSAKHVAKNVWKSLAATVSARMEDQAVAIVHFKSESSSEILAEDGLHDALRQVVSMSTPNALSCPFMTSPGSHALNLLDNLASDDEARSVYEFIEHYWGWRIFEDGSSIYLMLFGADPIAPTESAQDAAILCKYVAWHLSTEKRRQQLMSDLTAEIQGLRISPSTALRCNIELWVGKNARNP